MERVYKSPDLKETKVDFSNYILTSFEVKEADRFVNAIGINLYYADVTLCDANSLGPGKGDPEKVVTYRTRICKGPMEAIREANFFLREFVVTHWANHPSAPPPQKQKSSAPILGQLIDK